MTHTLRLFLFVLTVVAYYGMAACGGDDSGFSESSTTTETSETTEKDTSSEKDSSSKEKTETRIEGDGGDGDGVYFIGGVVVDLPENETTDLVLYVEGEEVERLEELENGDFRFKTELRTADDYKIEALTSEVTSCRVPLDSGEIGEESNLGILVLCKESPTCSRGCEKIATCSENLVNTEQVQYCESVCNYLEFDEELPDEFVGEQRADLEDRDDPSGLLFILYCADNFLSFQSCSLDGQSYVEIINDVESDPADVALARNLGSDAVFAIPQLCQLTLRTELSPEQLEEAQALYEQGLFQEILEMI